jgi:diacylglycerol kinase (ATP)
VNRYRFLVNRVAGSGKAPELVERVARTMRAAGATVQVDTSLSAEHSRGAVAEAIAAGEVVVAAGGDGMLASVAGSVVDGGGTLGIVPGGRGNDFARMLGLPDEPDAIARTLLAGNASPVDVICVQTETGERHVVLGSMYSGVDSLASEIVDASRRLPSAAQYPYAAVRSLLTYKPGGFTVTVDGETTEHDAYTVVVANSAYYGKGMKIAPAADVRDGFLDVVVLPAGSRLAMVRRLNKVYDGSHVDLDGVVVHRGRSVTVAADREVVAYGDGERLGPLPRTASVLPGALKVLV